MKWYWVMCKNAENGNLRFELYRNRMEEFIGYYVADYEIETKMYSKEVIESKEFQKLIIDKLETIKIKIKLLKMSISC